MQKKLDVDALTVDSFPINEAARENTCSAQAEQQETDKTQRGKPAFHQGSYACDDFTQDGSCITCEGYCDTAWCD